MNNVASTQEKCSIKWSSRKTLELESQTIKTSIITRQKQKALAQLTFKNAEFLTCKSFETVVLGHDKFVFVDATRLQHDAALEKDLLLQFQFCKTDTIVRSKQSKNTPNTAFFHNQMQTSQHVFFFQTVALGVIVNHVAST